MKIYLPTPERLCHCNAALIDPDALAALEEGYLRLRLADVSTPLKKHLPRRVFALLQFRTSPMGASLLDVVQQGMLHHDAPVGAVLPDPTAYETFQVLLDPLLDERHFGFDAEDSQPPVDWGDWNRLRSLDPRRKYIHATAVSACRNLPGFHFTPTIVPEELHKVEDTILLTLYKLPGVYKGKYEFINCMPPTRKKQLQEDFCLFTCGDKYDHAANVPRFWSYGRGVFVNKERNFFVWINSRDHMRVISQEKNGDLQTAYRRLVDVMPVLDECLRPVRHERLGFLTVNLDNLGSGLILSARMCLPNLPQSVLESITKVYHMETKLVEENIYLITHNGHLGYTEFEVVREFNHGVREVLFMARFYDTKKKKKKPGNDGSDKPDGPDKPGGPSPRGGGGGQGDMGTGEQSGTTTETVTETVTTVDNDEPGGGGGGGPAPIIAPPPQDFIWARPSVIIMRASVSTMGSRPSVHRVAPSEAKDHPYATTNFETPSETELSAQKLSTQPKLTFYDDILNNNERRIDTVVKDQPATHPPLETRSSWFQRRGSQPEDLDGSTPKNEVTSQDGTISETEEVLNVRSALPEGKASPVTSENITPQQKKSPEIVTTLNGVFHFEEKALSSARDAGTAHPPAAASTAPKHSDSADLIYTGGLPEEKSAREAPHHKHQRRTSTDRLDNTPDLSHNRAPLADEQSPSPRTSATRVNTPSSHTVTRDSEAAEMFYLGGVLPEERTRPVNAENTTPQRQSSREKFSRLSGVFHVGRRKSKEGSQTSVRDAGIVEPSASSSAPKHNDSADLFYTGGFLPEERSKRDASIHTTPKKPPSVDRLSSAADVFYKGAPLPEERSLSTRRSTTETQKTTENRDPEDSEVAEMFYLGGELPEERTRPVTSGSATPQRQSSRDKFPRFSGVFHVGRNKSKEGSKTSVRDAGITEPSASSSAPKHNDSADLFYTGGFLPEERSKRDAPRHTTPEKPASVDRFSSAADVFYKGAPLPEERSLSTRRSATQIQKPTENRDSQDSEVAEMFYLGGELPEERTRPDTSGSATPQRQSSRDKFSRLSGLFHVGRHKSKEGSLSNVKDAGTTEPPGASTAPTHSDSADLFYTGGFLPEEKSTRETPRHTSPDRPHSNDRFSSATDMFYKGAPLPEERSVSTRRSATQAQKPTENRDTQESEVAEMFYLGGELPEERTKPVTSGSATPQRQSSREKFSRSSGLFLFRHKSKEGSQTSVRDAGIIEPSASSSAPKHSDSADLFYTGGFLPEERSKRDAPRHSTAQKPPSVDRFSSTADVFYKGAPLPEERSLSTRRSVTQTQKHIENRDTQDSEVAEMFYLGGELPEERTRPVTSGSATPQRQSSRDKFPRLSGVFHVGRHKSKEGSKTSVRDAGITEPSASSSAPKHNDSADLFYTGGFLPEERSKRDAPRHTTPEKPASVDRFSSAADVFYKGAPLPEERSLSTRRSATQIQKPTENRDSQDSEVAEMFYLGGELPEERTRPVTSGSATPQRQSSRDKFPRLSGVFHVGRHKSKEGSKTSVRDAGITEPSASSSAPKHNDSADLFYTGGFLPEERSKRDAPRQTTPEKPASVDRFSSAADVFYKGAPLPEERSLSTRRSATQIQKPTENRDSQDSEVAEMFYLGGELPEERTRPDTSGSATPQRQSSRDKFSRLSGLFHVGRHKSKEGSLSNVKDAGTTEPPGASTAPTHSDSADLFYTGGFLPEEKSTRETPRHTGPDRPHSNDRFSSATDMFYKGAPLPEERSVSTRRSVTQAQKPTENRDTQESEVAEMFYLGGELPEERTKPVTSGSATPQRQSSREKFSRSSGLFLFRHKSKEGSQTSVRDAGIIEPSASSSAPKHSDSADLFYTGGFLPEERSKRDAPRHSTAQKPPSVDRFSSTADVFYKGAPLPEERSLSTRRSVTQTQKPNENRETQDSEVAEMFYLGGELPEERSRPVTSGSATPQRQSSRDKFSRLSGLFHVGRHKSKEGSLSNVRDAGTTEPPGASTVPTHSDSADLFYTGGFLPEEKSTRETIRHTSPDRPQSNERFSSATDMFYKGAPLPEERSLSTRRSATQAQKPTENRDTQESEVAEMFYLGGELPEERTRPVTSGSATPQRQSSRDKFSRLSGLFHVGRHKSKEGSLSNIKDAGAIETPGASTAPTHSDSADLFYTGGYLPEEKSTRETPRHTSPDRAQSNDRFSSATDLFYKGAPLPEERSFSTSRSAIQIQKPTGNRDTQDSEVAEMFYLGGELPEERSRPVTSESATPQRQTSRDKFSRLSGLFHVGRHKSKEGSLSNIKDAGAIEAPGASTAPTHSDSADLFFTGGYLPEEKSTRETPRHTSPDRAQSNDRFSSATDLFYKGAPLPEERSLSTPRSGTQMQKPSETRDTQNSEVAEMFYLGGELPEERTRPVTSGSATPQRQSSRDKFSRLSGVFHIGRHKSKEGSLSNIKDAGATEAPAASTAPTHSDPADLFYTGGILPEEKSTRDAPHHTRPDRPESADRFSSATDMFYKGAPLPEERSLFTRKSATQIQKPSENRDTQDSEVAEMFYLGGELPEERTIPVTSGSTTPQRQSSRDKFSRSSGLFIFRHKSKEGSQTSVRDASVIEPSASSSKRDASQPTSPERPASADRFSSATDFFYKGAPLPEERSLSTRRSATQIQKPTENRNTEDSEVAEMFYMGGELPEERTRPVTAGSATPQRQSSRDKFSRLSGLFHVGRHKSKEGSLSNVKDAGASEPPVATCAAPTNSDSADLFYTRGVLPDEKSARNASRHTSPDRPHSVDRFSSATDMFYKGAPLPEERSLSTRRSATQTQKPTENRDTQDSEVTEMFYLGGELPEERTRPVTSGSSTPQRQSSREKFSRLSGVFHIGRHKSKEGSLANVKDTGTVEAPASEEKSTRDTPRHISPDRSPSVERFSSATDMFYKGAPLPEERTLSTRRSATQIQKPSENRDSQVNEAAGFLKGVQPEKNTGSVYSGNAAPQRQSSHQKVYPLSAELHEGRQKSIKGSLSNVPGQNTAKLPAVPTAPHSDATRKLAPEQESKRDASHQRSSERPSTVTDSNSGLNTGISREHPYTRFQRLASQTSLSQQINRERSAILDQFGNASNRSSTVTDSNSGLNTGMSREHPYTRFHRLSSQTSLSQQTNRERSTILDQVGHASNVSSNQGDKRARSMNDGSSPDIRNTFQRTHGNAAHSNENQIGTPDSSQLPNSVANSRLQGAGPRTVRLFPDNNLLSDVKRANAVVDVPSSTIYPSSDVQRSQPAISAIWPQKREILVSFADTPPSNLHGGEVDEARGQEASPQTEERTSESNVIPSGFSKDETKSTDVKKFKK